MKRLTLSTLAIATALFAAQASAGDRYDRYDDRYDRQARYDDRYDSRHDGRYDRGNAYGRWDTARVVRVERIGGYGRDYGPQCRTRYGGRDDGSDGAVLGARSNACGDLPAWMICAGSPARAIKPRVMAD